MCKVCSIKFNKIIINRTCDNRTFHLTCDIFTVRNIEMKKQQELLKQERDKMMKVADKLDSHVAQLVLELEKKSTMLNEALETLKRREEFLSHEREIFEEKVQWERNHLQVFPLIIYLIIIVNT